MVNVFVTLFIEQLHVVFKHFFHIQVLMMMWMYRSRPEVKKQCINYIVV